jgi:hypothetical protein
MKKDCGKLGCPNDHRRKMLARWDNGIALGATAESVIKQLGKPMRVGPSSLPNTDVWSYQPWTFSIEMSGGRVTSMRVADPQFN